MVYATNKRFGKTWCRRLQDVTNYATQDISYNLLNIFDDYVNHTVYMTLSTTLNVLIPYSPEAIRIFWSTFFRYDVLKE